MKDFRRIEEKVLFIKQKWMEWDTVPPPYKFTYHTK